MSVYFRGGLRPVHLRAARTSANCTKLAIVRHTIALAVLACAGAAAPAKIAGGESSFDTVPIP